MGNAYAATKLTKIEIITRENSPCNGIIPSLDDPDP
jgi:hypothetical protein